MTILAQQKNDPVILTAIVLLIGGLFGVSLAEPLVIPWALALLPIIVLLAYWVVRWDVMVLSWIWLISYGCLDFDELKIEVPGMLMMSPPRLLFIAASGVYLLYFLRRGSLRFDRKVLWLFLALVLYLGWSANNSGWVSDIDKFKNAPIYRYFEAFLLPFIMLVLVYNVVRSSKQAAWPFVLMSILGWYVLYVGFLQFAYGAGMHWANSLIFPQYIVAANDAIDLERARGPFRGAGMQSMFLVALFYMNMYSIRRIRGGYRVALALQIVLIPLGIFFTGVRAGYVAFFLCGIVWFLWGHRYRAGRLKLAVATMVLLIGTLIFWDNLSDVDRRGGGVAQTGPMYARWVLAAQAYEILQDHPWFGVGFGHFIDYQVQMPRDPQSLAGLPLDMVAQHNVFLTVLSEAGLIGLFGLLALLIAVFRESTSLYRKIPIGATGWVSRELVVAFWIIMLNYIVCGMFRDTFWEIPGCVLLWSMAGLIVGYNRLLEPHQIDPTNGSHN
jgi:hypothetical protein